MCNFELLTHLNNIILTDKYKRLEIRRLLRNWYDENKRDLPWRHTNDPYKIWISEVILQQTRVVQGLNYYLRFVDRFPTVKSLAISSEEEVLKMWQGLGYYSRARHLHSAAKMILSEFNGKIPNTYKEIISLKGIGEYTAAAILSTAYDKPYAVVDGNVYRVLSRLFAIKTPIDTTIGKKEFAQLSQVLLDVANPGIHNQALMEFGALHCTPTQPKCDECPLSNHCVSNKLNIQSKLPVKKMKTKIRKRYLHYFYFNIDGYTYLNKREERDIWKNLYEFPLIETDIDTSFIKLTEKSSFKEMFRNLDVTFSNSTKQVRHILTHQHIYANFYEVELANLSADFELGFLKVKNEDVYKYPISRLIHRYLEQK